MNEGWSHHHADGTRWVHPTGHACKEPGITEPKPVELTDAELDALTEAGEVALPNRALVAAIVDDLVPAIIRIVEAREAAARREALLEAADALPKMTEGDERIGTRRFPPLRRDAYSLAIEEAQGALRALAEPERDEDGGR